MKNYTVISTIAKAIFGDVVKCRRIRDGRIVAIKRICMKSAFQQKTQRGNVQVFENAASELEILHLLKYNPNRNVLGLIDEFQQNGILHIVMEYCPTDMFTELDAFGAMDAPMVKKYLNMIVYGLRHVHEMGYAHMDISLENILINDMNECKLCDFGLASNANVLSDKAIGKSFYMAPEVRQQKVYSPKAADMWSLGIVLFIMITGIPPFEVADVSDVRFAFVKQHGIRKLLQSWHLSHKIPTYMLSILEQLIEIDPKSRLQSPTLLKLLEDEPSEPIQ